MATHVSNQKPVFLSPEFKTLYTGDFSLENLVHENISEKCFQPMNPNNPVVVQDDKGNNIVAQNITDNICNSLGSQYNSASEQFIKGFFQQTLACYTPNTLTVNDTFAVQSAAKCKLPMPSNTVIYTAKDDVIPASTQLIAGACDWNFYFASLAMFARIDNMSGVYFSQESEFIEFQNYIQTELNMLTQAQAPIPQDTLNLFNGFFKLQLNQLTESIILRNDYDENNEEWSFARMLMYFIMEYKANSGKGEDTYGLLPFSLLDLYCPCVLIFVNVEKHARATAKEINDEWKTVKKSLASKPTVMSNKQINKLTTVQRNLQKMGQMAQMNIAMSNMPANKAARAIRFMKKQPSAVDIHKLIQYKFKNMANVVQSENTIKLQKMTFNRPSRRNPDSPDIKGKASSIKFRPDIHIYLDCSGSISEENYRDAVKSLIILAKKMNVNMYFNSFSHVMSESKKIIVKNKTTTQVFNEIIAIPKVSGGTDFEQIWHYINASPKRKKELSLIITDMEFTARRHFVKHPRWCYYVPISNAPYGWKYLIQAAEEFCQSMQHIDPNIRNKILIPKN